MLDGMLQTLSFHIWRQRRLRREQWNIIKDKFTGAGYPTQAVPMLQPSGFSGFYSSLPSPKSASSEFLLAIGLRPEPFQQWLCHLPIDMASSDNWTAVLRMYVQHRDITFEYCEDRAQELQSYGITRQLADEVLQNVGEHYGEMLPRQYITAAVEDRLEQVVLTRGKTSDCCM